MSTLSQARDDDRARVHAHGHSLSWDCVFCGKLRIFEGGRPLVFSHLDTCPVCGSRVTVKPSDRAAVAALVDNHLL